MYIIYSIIYLIIQFEFNVYNIFETVFGFQSKYYLWFSWILKAPVSVVLLIIITIITFFRIRVKGWQHRSWKKNTKLFQVLQNFNQQNIFLHPCWPRFYHIIYASGKTAWSSHLNQRISCKAAYLTCAFNLTHAETDCSGHFALTNIWFLDSMWGKYEEIWSPRLECALCI